MSARSIVRSTNNRSRITINSVRPSEPFVFRGQQSAIRIPQFARHLSLVTHHAAFTLLELLVVIGVISILLVAVIPAINLTKSSGRKGAISNLLGAIEQARAEAIKTGQATYVVFPTFSSASQTTLDRYNYKSYAIWEDDPTANPVSQKQLTNWKTLPTGVAIRSKTGSSESITNLANTSTMFTFTPESRATASFYYIKFNANGEVEAPPSPPSNVTLAVFEGYVNGGNEAITSTKDSNGEPAARESITIARLTGRAEHQ